MAVGGVSNLFQVSLYIDLKSIESPEDFGPLSEFVLLVVHGEPENDGQENRTESEDKKKSK